MSGKSDRAKDTTGPAEAAAPDFDQFAQNMGRLVEEYGKITAAYLKPLERGEAKTGQAYQMQRIMLYILPLAFIFSGVFFPLGVVIYWFVSNLWTMAQQFIVIRNLPTPGSEAAKEREERLARKGKALDAKGRVIPMEKYQAEQQRLLEEAERARAAAPKRQQPMGKQRAKKKQPPKSGSPAPKAGDKPSNGGEKPKGGPSTTPPPAPKS